MNPAEAQTLLNLARTLVSEQTAKPLDELELAVLEGILLGQTYKQICQDQNFAQGVDYIKKCVAYQLRRRLTQAMKSSGYLTADADNLKKKTSPVNFSTFKNRSRPRRPPHLQRQPRLPILRFMDRLRHDLTIISRPRKRVALLATIAN